MTKILNSLKITGTGSTSQALGVTGGNVNVNSNLSVGTWNPSSDTNFYILSGSTSTFPMRIRDFANAKDIIKTYNSGAIEINTNQTSSSVTTLTLGSTSSANGVGVLQIGSTNSGVTIIGDTGYPSILSSGGRFAFGNSYNSILNYNPIWFQLGTQSGDTPMISSNTNGNRGIRLASGGGTLSLSTNVPTGTTWSTLDRLVIPSGTYSNPSFVNIGTLNIDSVSITSRDISTFSYNPKTFILGASGSSINMSGMTSPYIASGIGTLIISPNSKISMTSSNFPLTGLTAGPLNNIFIVTTNSFTPQTSGGNNTFLSSETALTSGGSNVSVGIQSLRLLTTGSFNTSIGAGALVNLLSGSNNTGVGSSALNSLTTGNANVGIGYRSGLNNTADVNIFIGNESGKYYNGTGGNVLYLSSVKSANLKPSSVHYSSSTFENSGIPITSGFLGTPSSWMTSNNFGNVVIIGNESGFLGSSDLTTEGTYRSLFFGKGMWQVSNQVYTYTISTSLPSMMTWSASVTTATSAIPNTNAPGSSLELVAAPGRGSGTSGDLYFSTGQPTQSGTGLQDKVTRMTIKGGSGFIGIGTQSPSTLLHIYSTQSGAFRLVDGTQGAGKALISDANGNASWGTASGSGVSGGSASFVALFSSATTLTASSIYQGTSNGTIVIGYTSSLSSYNSDTNALRVKGGVYFDNNTLTGNKFFLNGTFLFDDSSKQNIALGYNALNGNGGSVGTGNVAIGMYSIDSSISGNYNIGIGYSTLTSMTGSSDNIAIGYTTLQNLTTGSSNTAIGREALLGNISGSNNISVGLQSLRSATSSSNNISIGNLAQYSNTSGSNNVSIGGSSLYSNISGANNVGLGLNSLNGLTGGSFNVAIGNYSQESNKTGQYNTSLGYWSLRGVNNTGDYNVALGPITLWNNTTGTRNIALGESTLLSNTGGNDNIGLGVRTLMYVNGTGSNQNIAIGTKAAWNFGGKYDVYPGGLTGASGSGGFYNTFIGHGAGWNFLTGNFNTFISSFTTDKTNPSNGNTEIGLTSGYFNTWIGQLISASSSSNYANTVIGSQVSIPSGVTSSIIISDGLGNQRIFVNNFGYVGIGTQTPSTLLHVSSLTPGAFRLVDSTQGYGKFLVSDSNGVGSWTNSLPIISGTGLTISISSGTYSLSISNRVSSKSADFTVGNSEWGYLYSVTTAAALINVTLPTVSNGFKFSVSKVDAGIGVVQIPVKEYASSPNSYTQLTRMGQTAEFIYDGTNWSSTILDEGVVPPSTVFANLSTTYSHVQEIPVIDLNDTVQKAINYNQGGLTYDWLSGVMYSSFQPILVSGQTSMFNTASNCYVGSVGSPTQLPAYSLTRGKSIRVEIAGTVSGSGTLNISPKIGSVTFSTTLITLGSANNTPFNIHYTFKVMSVGLSGSVHGSGIWYSSGLSSSMVNIMDTTLPYSVINTTSAGNIDFIVATASSPASMTVIHSTIERLA